MNPWNAQDLTFDESTFSGVGRIFPLPNLVLYPHVVQPLHVFEERYCEMVEDALAGDRLIAMAILEPGWEIDYEGRPPIAPIGCLGKIIAHHRQEDGRYNLLLLGVRRVGIGSEIEPVRAFRRAELELLSDCDADQPSQDPERLRQRLLREFRHHLPEEANTSENLEQILSEHIPLGALTDLVSYTMPMDMEVKQQLLAECCTEHRAEMLLEQLGAQCDAGLAASSTWSYPPRFSDN